MNRGNIENLVNGTESLAYYGIVAGSTAAYLDTGSILNGNEDGWYRVIIRTINTAADAKSYLTFNGDGGANYGIKAINAANTTVGDYSYTGRTAFWLGDAGTSGNTMFCAFNMYAKSGSVRMANGVQVENINGTSVNTIRNFSCVWSNTADNITSMRLALSSGNLGIGTEFIVLKCNNFTTGKLTGNITTPYIKGCWKRIDSRILGSAANTVTFSGLDGDKAVLFYISSIAKAASATGDIKINLNNDTGNNYGYQRCSATDTTISASRATPSCIYAGVTGTNAYFSKNSTLLFSKQGFIRPAISQTMNDVTGTTVTSLWTLGQSYAVTNTNVTEIDITASTNNFDAGSQFEIYGLFPNGL